MWVSGGMGMMRAMLMNSTNFVMQGNELQVRVDRLDSINPNSFKRDTDTEI